MFQVVLKIYELALVTNFQLQLKVLKVEKNLTPNNSIIIVQTLLGDTIPSNARNYIQEKPLNAGESKI